MTAAHQRSQDRRGSRVQGRHVQDLPRPSPRSCRNRVATLRFIVIGGLRGPFVTRPSEPVPDRPPLSGALFEVALEAIGEAVLVTTPDLASPGPVIVYANPAFCRMTGYACEEVVGRSPRFLQGPGTDRVMLDRVRETLSRGDVFRGEAVNYRKDGSTYRIEWLITPMHDGTGQLSHWIAVQRDITEQRRTEAALREAGEQARASERHQRYLVNELQHRTRNLLGVVTAVANRTVKRGGSVEAFEKRLQALSRVQGLLSEGASDTVDVGAMVRAELVPYTDSASAGVTISGPEASLNIRQVQNFALALHELTTNAVKYGALKDDAGQLAVTWELTVGQRGRQLVLSWIESGVAMDPAAVTRRGYGTELIQHALAYALAAEVDYVLGEDGVRCRIEIPIP
ncbi:PAS domain S-box protein (plasmid) [Methylobacterium sp. NMS12]|uniref:PAS domain S-box protein n=1 Tax=Methylobacterium sp. NMS12 TaxID=3079766 RepID=UPI003F8825E7